MLAGRPRHVLDDDAAGRALHPPHAVQHHHQEAPHGDEREPPLREMIGARGRLLAVGAPRGGASLWEDLDADAGPVSAASRTRVDEASHGMTLVE